MNPATQAGADEGVREDRHIQLPGGYYLFQLQPDHMTCSLHAKDGLHIGNLLSAEAGDFAAALSTQAEQVAELERRLAAAEARVATAEKALNEARKALERARPHVAATIKAEHMLDGFGRRQRRPADDSLDLVDNAISRAGPQT